MNIEIREDSVLISGYVNAVERLSKPIRESIGGKIRTFLERIKAGVFRKALKRNDNVLVLLNHNPKRVLADTKSGTAKLEEDNIGLKAEITITDSEVVEKARENRLSGWSFGFYANAEEMSNDGTNDLRTITDMDLVEVSILDDTKEPAYYGTLIEARGEEMKALEIRVDAFETEAEETEVTETEETEAEETKAEQTINVEDLANLIADIVVAKLKGGEEEAEAEEETEEDVADGQDAEGEAESRAIDYSAYEERLKSLTNNAK